MHRCDRGITGVIGVMRGGPIDDIGAFAHGQVIGDRDRLRVGDAEAMEMARSGVQVRTRVAAPGCGQVDRGAIAEIVAFAVTGEIALMGAPARAPPVARLR